MCISQEKMKPRKSRSVESLIEAIPTSRTLLISEDFLDRKELEKAIDSNSLAGSVGSS